MMLGRIGWSIRREGAAVCSAVKATRFAGDPNKFGSALTASTRCRNWLAVIEGSHCRLHLPRPRHPSGTAPRLGGTIPLATATLNRPIAGLCSVHGVAEPSCRRARQRRRWARGEARGRSARAPRCRSWRPNAAASGGGQGCRELQFAAPRSGCLDGRARCRTLAARSTTVSGQRLDDV